MFVVNDVKDIRAIEAIKLPVVVADSNSELLRCVLFPI
jgi:hypothetical protein